MTAAMTPGMRAVAGAVVSLLLIATSYLGARVALGALDEHYTVSVRLGDLGQGVVAGTDVKMRGVRVGAVGDIALDEDYHAVAELVLDDGVQVPERSIFRVSGKTLLGEKQIEVLFDGPVEDGPYFDAGTLIDDPGRVVEVEDVVAALARITGSIDPDDIATIFDDFFGAFDGMGPTIARGIDAGGQAAGVFARTLPDQVAGTHDLSLVAEALQPTGEEFNRLGRNVVEGMPTLSENQAGITALLDALRGFARELGVTFRVARPDIDRMMINGDNVLRVLFHYRMEIGEVVEGVVTYTALFGEGFRNPGVTGQAAYFEILLQGEDFEAAFCEGMPPEMAQEMPGCAGEQAQGEMHALLPRDLVRPDVPQIGTLDEVLRRTLRGMPLSGGAGEGAA